MKDLKTELKQHFIKAYANQHFDSYAGYLEDWDINAVIAAAELEFNTFIAANRGWYYESIKNVIIPEFTNRAALMEMYKKRNEYLGIPANYGFPLEHSVRMAYSEPGLAMGYRKNPAIKDTFEVKSEIKFKGFNGSDFPNDENNRRWVPLVENSHYADIIAYALSVYKLPADIFEKLSVIEWFEAQGTSKHLSIAKRLREIIGNLYQVHDEIISEA